ncbi:MAG: PorV/PorQ family protein [bacterium]|nr:PorV/PorQ family protein [bacterium]
MKRLLLSLIILLIGMPSICWGDGACITAMPFLKMGMGVRASAMGKAFCAVADDVSAVYYNPAGLGQIKRGQINLEHTRWFEDVGYTCVSGVYPLKTMSIGGFANMLLTDEMQTTTEAKPQGTGKTFREIDGIFGMSWGINLTDHISVGATGKICSQRIGDKDAVGFASDVGFLCKTKHVGLGLALQNIGADIKFIDKGFALPATIRTGLVWTNSWLTISGGMTNILPEKKTVACVGLEGWILNTIALRGGYDSEDGHGFTAGFGARTPGRTSSSSLEIDYAYLPYEKFEAAHRLSASVRFGSKAASKLSDAAETEKILKQAGITPAEEKTENVKKVRRAMPQETDQQLDRAKKTAPLPARSYDIIPQQSEQPVPAPDYSAVSAPPAAAPAPSIPAVLPKPQAPVVQKQAVQTPVLSQEQPSKQIRTVIVAIDNTPIFSGPGTRYPIITTVPDGIQLILVDDSKQWYYQVKLPDNKLGWISYANCQK